MSEELKGTSDIVSTLSEVIVLHNTEYEINSIKSQVEHLLSLGRTEVEVLAVFNIGVEEVVLGQVEGFNDGDFLELQGEQHETYEEQLFSKEVNKIDFSKFQSVNKITSLEIGDLVDFDIRGFLRFIIVKIKGTVVKGGKIYAQCIVNAAKLDTEAGEPKKKFLLNREYSIELPIVSGQNLVIASENGEIACLRIISMSLKRGKESKLGNLFRKITGN